MYPPLSALLLAVALIAPPLSVHASNMGFLEFSPSAYFTTKDWDLVKETADDLLNNQKDGESKSWKNQENDHNGKLTLLKTFSDFGTTCRTMEVFSDAIKVKATRVITLCKNKEGQWKVVD
jgi:surface antigen